MAYISDCRMFQVDMGTRLGSRCGLLSAQLHTDLQYVTLQPALKYLQQRMRERVGTYSH